MRLALGASPGYEWKRLEPRQWRHHPRHNLFRRRHSSVFESKTVPGAPGPALSLSKGSPLSWANLGHQAGGGYGIHRPDLDEDLSTEGLLRGRSRSRSQSNEVVQLGLRVPTFIRVFCGQAGFRR